MTNRLSTYVIMLIVSLTFLASCLDSSTNNTEIPSSFNLSLNVQGMGTDQFDGQNTIALETVKFTLGNLELTRENDENITFGQNLLVAEFTSDNTDDETIGTGGVAGGIYNGFIFEMLPPDGSGQITDSDLIEFNDDGEVAEAFSVFISGTFNDEPFEYRTSAELELDLTFEQMVDMPEVSGNMTVRLLPQTNNWFRDEDSRLINPNDANETETEQINENLVQSFSVNVVVFNDAVLL